MDEELAGRTIRKPVRLAVVGGVYVLFFLKNRAATRDVDVVAAFIPPLGPLTLWREYTHLHVYVPQADCMPALKLLSGRPRDAEDITALCQQLNISTREQAQALVDRYADRHWQQECMLEATLDALF